MSQRMSLAAKAFWAYLKTVFSPSLLMRVQYVHKLSEVQVAAREKTASARSSWHRISGANPIAVHEEIPSGPVDIMISSMMY